MFQIKKESDLFFVYKDNDKISIGFKDEKSAQDEIINLSKDCKCPFKDKIFTQNVSFKDDGNTEKRTVISIRDGVQEYLGVELGIEPLDKVFRIYRSPETIRKLKDTLVGIPLIENHIEPDGHIPDDIKKGTILNSTEIENIDSSNNSTIAMQNEITLYKDKLEFPYKQLSLGYKAKTLPSADYDFEQTEIIPHHLAIVEAGRCGDVCEFKDEKGVKPMDLNELLAKLKEMLTNASDADKALILEAMDGIIPKVAVVDEDAMLNYGNERASIVAKAKNFLDEKFDFKDKTNEAIMSAVVAAEYPNETFKDAEIGVAFKLLKEKEQTVQAQMVDFKDTKENMMKIFEEEMK